MDNTPTLPSPDHIELVETFGRINDIMIACDCNPPEFIETLKQWMLAASEDEPYIAEPYKAAIAFLEASHESNIINAGVRRS